MWGKWEGWSQQSKEVGCGVSDLLGLGEREVVITGGGGGGERRGNECLWSQ